MSSQFLPHIHIVISFCSQSIALTVGCGNDHETNCTQLFTQIGNFGFTATESARKYQFVAQFPFLQISRKILLKVFSIFDSLASKRCDGGKGQFTIKSKILPSKMFAIFSHLLHSHIQDSRQEITEIINGKSLNLGTAQ